MWMSRGGPEAVRLSRSLSNGQRPTSGFGGSQEVAEEAEGSGGLHCIVVASVYDLGPFREATINQLPFSALLRFLPSLL